MIIRIARIFTLGLVIYLILGVRPVIGDGLSMTKSYPDSQTETKKAPPKSSKSQPSTLDKMTSGTKKFFSNIGDTLTGRKSAPPKKSTMPTNPWIKPPKEEPQKTSWFTSMFYKEEPKKPSSASEWLGQKRLDP